MALDAELLYAGAMTERLHPFVDVTPCVVRDLLCAYGRGRLCGVERCARGLVNSSFRIDAEDGVFLLRIYSGSRPLPEIAFELEVLQWLGEREFGTQRPIRRLDGKFLSSVRGRACALFAFLPGDTVDRFSALTGPMVRQVGSRVGRMQNLLSGCSPQGAKPNADYPFIRDFTTDSLRPLRLRPQMAALVETFDRQLREARATFEQKDPGLRVGVVHADISPENVLFLGDRMSGLIDFDDAYVGWQAGDLALALMEFCFDEGHREHLDLAQEMLRGYVSERALSQAEAAHLVPLMQLLCMKYFCCLLPRTDGAEGAILASTYYRRLVRLREPPTVAAFNDVIYKIFPTGGPHLPWAQASR